MSGLLDAEELLRRRIYHGDCYDRDGVQDNCEAARLLRHIDALQAELDRLRAENLHHASTLGYVLVTEALDDEYAPVWLVEGAEGLGTLFPTVQAAEDQSAVDSLAPWQTAAVLPLTAFEHP